MKSKKHINWLNTIFLTVNPLVGIIGTVLIFVYGHFSWETGLLAIFMAAMGGFSITAGYHRLFSHVTYKASWIVRLVFVLFGAATFEGSVLEWCTDHRNHHLYTDTPKDPYNSKEGFWYAHIGWLFTLDTDKRDFRNVDELAKDPIVKFQHDFYLPIAIFMGFILPALIAALWGDVWGGLIIAGSLRTVYSQHITFCVNSVCHIFGSQPYSDRNTARDNWITALFTFGEGYHNFHHKFPLDYRNGIRFFHFDPTKWLIRGLGYLGLTREFKIVSEHKIIQYRLEMVNQKLKGGLQKAPSSINEHTLVALKSMYDAITQLLSQCDSVEKKYRQLKLSNAKAMEGCAAEYRRLIRSHRRLLNKLSADTRRSMKAWSHLVNQALFSGVTDSRYS